MEKLKPIIRNTIQLHRLLRQGEDESSEAEAIRDQSDVYWKALSEEEKDFIRWLSEELYSL